jgi:cysteine synthase B
MQVQRSTASHHLAAELRRLDSLIGNTPLYAFNRICSKPGVTVLGKLEWFQLGGSVKARPAYNIIREAILNGWLGSGQRLIDASSGNTGIAYAAICSALNIPFTLTMPEHATQERKTMLNALGTEVILTPQEEGTDGSTSRARELAEAEPGRYYYADQYNNDHNWQAHYKTTAEEIFRQTDGGVTHFAGPLGTTGTFVGAGRRLRELKPSIELVSMQPASPVHPLEGWKDLDHVTIPGIYDPTVADRQIAIDVDEPYEMVRRVAREEGLLISPSAAASLIGACQIANEIEEGVIVTTLADSADKYGEIMQQIFQDA